MMDGKPSDDPDKMREIFKIPEIIERLEAMQSCSDELPDEIVSAGDYKCRKNWWQGLIEEVESISKIQIFTGEEINEEITNFISAYTSTEFKKKEKVTREDIDCANQLIAKVLDRLR